MSRNDEPGFSAPVPGIGDFDAHGGAMSAPGTDGFAVDPPMYQDGGSLVGVAEVSHIYDSNAAGSAPMVPVHSTATNSAEDPLRDPVSHVVTPTSKAGNVITPPRPWAGS